MSYQKSTKLKVPKVPFQVSQNSPNFCPVPVNFLVCHISFPNELNLQFCHKHLNKHQLTLFIENLQAQHATNMT